MAAVRVQVEEDSRSAMSPDIALRAKMSDDIFKTRLHTPVHLFRADAIYMITGAIYQKQPIMKTDSRKVNWREAFIRASELYGWAIIAWVVLDNHYHVIVRSPGQNPSNLSRYVASFHKFTARRWNKEDKIVGRKVWWNYWDRCIRSEQDFINHLKYVFWNPVKHGCVDKPDKYRHSNYLFFLEEYFFSEDHEIIKEEDDVPEF